MKYSKIFNSWNSFLNESKEKTYIPSYNDPMLTEISDEVAEKVRAFSEQTPWDRMPFYNLFGEHSRKIIFMDVKPEGKIHDIIEFFEGNGWTVDFANGVVTKEMEDFKGNKKTAKMKIMKALLKVKRAVDSRHVKPDAFYGANHDQWVDHRGIPTGTLFRFLPDAPEKAKKMWKEYHRMYTKGVEAAQWLKRGPHQVFKERYTGRDVEAGERGTKTGSYLGRTHDGKQFVGNEGELAQKYHDPFRDAGEKSPYTISKEQYHDDTGNFVDALVVFNPNAAEFPNWDQYGLFHEVAPSPTRAGESREKSMTKIDSWIDYLNRPVVKGGGPAMDYFKRNPEVLKKMDKKPVIISRDPIDIVRMSDFPDLHSCHAEGGDYFKCAVREADNAGLVAYLIDPSDLDNFLFQFADDPDIPFEERTTIELDDALNEYDGLEIFEDRDRREDGMTPIARTRLRRFVNGGDGYELAVPEVRVYGKRYPGFVKAVTEWAYVEQEGVFEDYLPNPEAATVEEAKAFINDFNLTGGSYTDTIASELFYNMFKIESLKGIRHSADHDPEGRYEDDPEYSNEEQEYERLEQACQEVYDEYYHHLDHAGIGHEVEQYDEHPYCSFWGDIQFAFEEEEQTEEIVPPQYPSHPAYDAIIEDLHEEWDSDSFYGHSTYSDSYEITYAAKTLYVNVRFSTEDYEPNEDGYYRFCEDIVKDWDDRYDAAKKIAQRVLRKHGYIKPSAIEGKLSALEGVKNFTWEDEPSGYVFELEELIPIGYGFNYPAILAKANWVSKLSQDARERFEQSMSDGNYNQHKGYTPKSGSKGKSIQWDDIARRILNFVAKESLDAAGQYGTKTGEKSKQGKLPIDEITGQSPQSAAQEEEMFAIANLEPEYNDILHNFTVKVMVADREISGASQLERTPKMLKGWEEYGQRKGEHGYQDKESGAKLVRGPKAIIPLEMDIIFNLKERDMIDNIGNVADMVMWMDNNLDKVQQHAEAVLQEYNKIYLADIQKRVDNQTHEEDFIEETAGELAEAREQIMKELGPLLERDLEGTARSHYNNLLDSFERNRRVIMEYLMDWEEGEPPPDGLFTHWAAGKKIMRKFKRSRYLRSEYVQYLYKLQDMPSDDEENIYIRFLKFVDDEPREGPQDVKILAKESVISYLFQGYWSAVTYGYSNDSEAAQMSPNNYPPLKYLIYLKEFDWERENAYWRAKASRAKRRAERDKQKSLNLQPRPSDDEQVDEGCGPPKRKKLKLRIGKRK